MTELFDAIVVLGKGVLEDGTLPLISQHELDRALGLLQTQPASTIICSGKYSAFRQLPYTLTEAVAMQRYLFQQGVPSEGIILENQSVDTITNVVNVAQICQQRQFTRVLLISNAEHLARVEWIAQRVFSANTHLSFHGHQHATLDRDYQRSQLRERLSGWYVRGLFSCFHRQSKYQLTEFIQRYHLVYQPWFVKLVMIYYRP